MELQRNLTHFKLKAIPILNSLDSSFFLRLAFFGTVVYGFGFMMSESREHMVAVPEEAANAPNRFSKTFGQEKRLDSILVQLNDEEDGKKK